MATAASYDSLLLEFKPRPIRNKVAYIRALRQIQRLMKQRRTKAEDDLLELLSTLVVQYESRVYPAPDISLSDLLVHLIESRGVTSEELCRETGIARSTISAVLRGERSINKSQASALGTYFGVVPSLFLPTLEGL